jgi:hypothetical protein
MSKPRETEYDEGGPTSHVHHCPTTESVVEADVTLIRNETFEQHQVTRNVDDPTKFAAI